MIAQGVKVADKNNAEKVKEEEKESGNAKKKGKFQLRECDYCGQTHKGAGKFCVARKCNAHLRPPNWKGTKVDK